MSGAHAPRRSEVSSIERTPFLVGSFVARPATTQGSLSDYEAMGEQ
ncbi:MAG: hypothetical protein NWR60_04315 [Candidatus Nanopelagicales bacterium]|nr:hypothetical protein [Candidatus Nanopelagicales bacterium]